MKQFFKFTLASLLGFVLAIVVIVVIFIGIISATIKSGTSKDVEVKSNSILHIKLNEPITDRASTNPFENFSLTSMKANDELGLNEILTSIKKAKEDENIKGIFLDVQSVNAGIAVVEEIRNALIDFKTSKKFIWSYSEGYTQGAYYLCSVSDSIWLNPQGIIELKGLSAQIMFYKGALEKLEVEPQIIRHGKFKSAVEPLINEKMSEANKLQISTYIGSLWGHVKNGIAQARKVESSFIQQIADQALIRNAKDAVKNKMADRLLYRDEVLEKLKAKAEAKEIDDIHFLSLGDYIESNKDKISETKENKGVVRDRIAVIYAVGEINSGEGDEKTIGSERISKAVRDARLDKNVKAIVLRVNSPGGSSLASDVIWREVVLARKAKPVVVSMGNVAASGGYYISCAADAIVANPNTITGSIGVFGVLMNAQGLLNHKLGITIDTAKTGKFADIGSAFRPLTVQEREIIQGEVEQIYDDFITKVAEGRKLSKAQVDSIGQGRVWTGIDAKRIGLVDELGGLDKAIEIAATKAKIKDYRIYNLPKQKDPFEEVISKLSGDAQQSMIKAYLGEEYVYYKSLRDKLKMQGLLTRMEFDVIIE